MEYMQVVSESIVRSLGKRLKSEPDELTVVRVLTYLYTALPIEYRQNVLDALVTWEESYGKERPKGMTEELMD